MNNRLFCDGESIVTALGDNNRQILGGCGLVGNYGACADNTCADRHAHNGAVTGIVGLRDCGKA